MRVSRVNRTFYPLKSFVFEYLKYIYFLIFKVFKPVLVVHCCITDYSQIYELKIANICYLTMILRIEEPLNWVVLDQGLMTMQSSY